MCFKAKSSLSWKSSWISKHNQDHDDNQKESSVLLSFIRASRQAAGSLSFYEYCHYHHHHHHCHHHRSERIIRYLNIFKWLRPNMAFPIRQIFSNWILFVFIFGSIFKHKYIRIRICMIHNPSFKSPLQSKARLLLNLLHGEYFRIVRFLIKPNNICICIRS